MSVENLYTPDCIRTFTGKYVNVFNPTPDMICLEDIAHALANQCRFGGHLLNFYSVAEHSIHCSKLVSAENKRAALFHDASEAYLIDVPRPVKQGLTNYKEIEDKLMRCIAERFNFEWPMPAEVKAIDNLLLELEWDQLMLLNKDAQSPVKFVSSSPMLSKDRFLFECNLLSLWV